MQTSGSELIRKSWNVIEKAIRQVMAFHLQFSTGSIPFLLQILILIPCATTIASSSSEAFAISREHLGSVATKRESLHGQLTASVNVHQKDERAKSEEGELTGFPTETGNPPTSSGRSVSYASSSQYSGQVSDQNESLSEWTRTALSWRNPSVKSSIDDEGGGDGKRDHHHVIRNWNPEKASSTSSSHKNSLHKRATDGISPPYLFLKIFMDYSSPNDEDLIGDGGKSGTILRRRRAHHTRALNGESGGQVVTLHIDERHNRSVIPSLPTSPNHTSPNGEHSGIHPSYVGSVSDGGNASSGNNASSTSSCPVGHFGCTNDPSLCVPQSAICDSVSQCPDGSDEYKCVNIHEKNFWDSFFQKRPASDDIIEGGQATSNSTCLYKIEKNTDENGSKLGQVEKNGVDDEMNFSSMLAKGMCRCSQEKVLCHNVHLPNLQGFPKDIRFLDLSGCRVDKLEFSPDRFQQLQTLVLSSCTISEITSETFSSLHSLKILHLTGVNHLRRIPPFTFSGNGNLTKLFLGHNQLETIDSQSFHGLQSLEYLDLRKNRLIGEGLVNVFAELGSLRILHLSYNEISSLHKELLNGLSHLEMLSLTKNKIAHVSQGAFNHTPQLKHLYLSYNNRLSVLENEMFCSLRELLNLNLNSNGIVKIERDAFACLDSLQSLTLEKNSFRDLELDADVENPRDLFANLTSLKHIYFDEWWMCSWVPHVRTCEPKGDGISSVDNLLDNVILRVCVWIMATVALVGNLFVLVSRLVIREKNKAHSFYIKNLAFADLLMGIFLLNIAIHDLKFRGHFLAHQHGWRHSFTCQFSGVLSTLSSESSVLILFVITLDRYLSIVRPFAERTNALIPAMLICLVLWIVSSGLSYAPLSPLFNDYFGKGFYSSNGLCLCLNIHNPFGKGWEYSLFLFIIINSVAFTFICYAYWKMLRIIQTSTTSIRSTQQKQDGMLVKRFGLVVFTDFICWAPIIIIKCVAMAGVEIQEGVYGFLAVFVLPVNSALNPVIYTLSTKLFKQQVSHITIGFRKRLGLATDESTTSSLFYRNRISRTLQTSMNSSMMYSTRRPDRSSTRISVLKDRMAKVDSGSGGGPITVSTTATSGSGHVLPNGDKMAEKVVEINGQIVQFHSPHLEKDEQEKVDGSENNALMMVESQL